MLQDPNPTDYPHLEQFMDWVYEHVDELPLDVETLKNRISQNAPQEWTTEPVRKKDGSIWKGLAYINLPDGRGLGSVNEEQAKAICREHNAELRAKDEALSANRTYTAHLGAQRDLVGKTPPPQPQPSPQELTTCACNPLQPHYCVNNDELERVRRELADANETECRAVAAMEQSEQRLAEAEKQLDKRIEEQQQDARRLNCLLDLLAECNSIPFRIPVTREAIDRNIAAMSKTRLGEKREGK